jgi:CRP/FNR family cyclic AMP-dependent transcriptional regulator
MRRGRVRRDAKLELLGAVPLFAGCSKSELRWVAGITTEEDFEAGAEVIREGELGWDFFVIVEGTADVRRKKRKVGTMGPGDFFGEIALVADSPRTATIVATTDLLALSITDVDFRELVLDQPSIAQKVLRSLGERIAADAR